MLVMQHLRAAVASVSVVAGFVAALFVPDDAARIPAKPSPVPVVPASCQQALIQGAHLIALSVDGAAQLLDVLDAKPSESLYLLDRYGQTLAATNKRLPTYTSAWRQCERSIG